jgi:small subunit ribosomal protein S1
MENATTAPESALEPKTHLTGKVIKNTLAGAVVDIGQKVPGVVHISQLSAEPINRVEDVVAVGQTVDVWVRRVRDDRVELTMIQPLGLEWRELKPDMIVKGRVARLESYGAFVDIGAERPGLVHVSEISHDYVKSPAEVLKEGDEVEAKILDVDRRKKQIRLSIKATQPEPEKVLAEVKKAEPRREQRKSGSGKRGKGKREEDYADTGPKEPELTSMEIAWQEAKAKAEGRKGTATRNKKTKSDKAKEQEEIFNRTLENRITTG